MKHIWNFEINLKKLNPLLKELGQLRRLLRINRLGFSYKELASLWLKEKWSRRNLFDIFFKLLMTFTDINDLLAYLMQLKLIPEVKLATLRKNTMDFYFY